MLSLYIISLQYWATLPHKSYQLILTEILAKDKYLTLDSTKDAFHYISYNMYIRTQDGGKIYYIYYKNMDPTYTLMNLQIFLICEIITHPQNMVA
jgi:hypothetical protein